MSHWLVSFVFIFVQIIIAVHIFTLKGEFLYFKFRSIVIWVMSLLSCTLQVRSRLNPPSSQIAIILIMLRFQLDFFAVLPKSFGYQLNFDIISATLCDYYLSTIIKIQFPSLVQRHVTLYYISDFVLREKMSGISFSTLKSSML